MAFRKSISQSELRQSRKERGIDDSRYATVYQPARGGWYASSKSRKRDKT